MSQKNVEVVERGFEVFMATGQLSDEFAPDHIWDLSAFRGWPDQPVFHGSDGFSEFITAWTQPYADWNIAVEKVLDAGGDRVVAVLVQRGRMRGSDAAVGMRYGVVYTVRDGQIRAAQVYNDHAEALEAVGLSE
jgi:ketosteroid isomerase-like protein